MFHYRAPKNQTQDLSDQDPIKITTPGSNIILTIEGVTHLREYAQGTSCK